MAAVVSTLFGVGIAGASRQAGAAAGTVVVTIEGFRGAAGHARVAVFNREAGFPDDESASYRKLVAEIKDGRVEVRFEGLPYGDYAVSMYHDANDDAKVNKGWFGIPQEGYGVSNNIVHATRGPRFGEALFRLAEQVHEVNIRVHY